MKASKKKPSLLYKASRNNLLLAFLFPFIAICAVLLFGSMEPFGNDMAVLYSDQYHQYYPFFVAFRNALRQGKSLLYTWDVGLGMDYLGMISYYVASPLNLLSVLVPDSLTLEYFSLLLPIRLGLASLFFAIFLKNIFEKDDLSIAVFGSFYGLCAWALAYQWNVMWLDTFALLPLVVLGTIQLLRDKKFILYTVTLFLSVFSNYYIGFFTCIFVLLLFLCYEICRFRSIGRFFADLGRIALFSVLAIGMTAVLELPTLMALQTTQSSVNEFPENFSMNIVEYEVYKPARQAWLAYKEAKSNGSDFLSLAGMFITAFVQSFPPLLQGMAQVAGNLGGGLIPSFKDGLPNLYCGIPTIALSFLYLSSREIKLRDKICSVGLLIFFMLSFLMRKLDYIWHGFHFTNQIPYRFSFLFSFVLLYMAYRAYTLRHTYRLWQYIFAALLSVCIVLFSESRVATIYMTYSLGFLTLFTGVFVAAFIDERICKKQELSDEELLKKKKQRDRWVTTGVTAVLCFELIMNVVNFGARFTGTSITDYPKGLNSAESMFRYLREDDSDFFRTEVTHTQTLNDGALNGYSGITTFTSSANVRVTEFMQALGYGAKNTYNRYAFEQSSPVANLFLNLKYMVERDGKAQENAYFDELHSYGGMTLLENNAYLPLGFLVNEAVANIDFSKNVDNFSFQNDLFTAATGRFDDVWTLLSGDCLTVTSTNATIKTRTDGGYTAYAANGNSGTLRYTYIVDQEGLACLDLNLTERNSYRVFLNGRELYSEKISLPQMISACDVKVGDKLEVLVSTAKDDNGSADIKVGIVNEEVFRAGYDVLASSTLDLTEFSDTRVKGKIRCDRDGLLYTSIPQNGNWSVTVDGEPAEIVLVGDAMIGVNLTKGNHTVIFTYRNEAFLYGLLISAVCAAVFVGLIFLSRSSLSKGKYEAKIPEKKKK